MDGSRRRAVSPVAASSARAISDHGCACKPSKEAIAQRSCSRARIRLRDRRNRLPYASWVRAVSKTSGVCRCRTSARSKHASISGSGTMSPCARADRAHAHGSPFAAARSRSSRRPPPRRLAVRRAGAARPAPVRGSGRRPRCRGREGSSPAARTRRPRRASSRARARAPPSAAVAQTSHRPRPSPAASCSASATWARHSTSCPIRASSQDSRASAAHRSVRWSVSRLKRSTSWNVAAAARH